MNPQETIDKIYDLATSVEGVAWFSSASQLDENQLSISEEAVSKIGSVLYEMRTGLAGAERALKGLLLKTEKRTIMNYFHGDSLVLLEVDVNAEIDSLYSSLKSHLGAPPTARPSLPKATPVQQTAQPVVADTAASAQSEEGPVSWPDLQKSLLTLFKKVAPAQLAKKLIATSGSALGVTDATTGITLEQASQIALKASEEIPNAARRKMLQKEIKTLLESLSA